MSWYDADWGRHWWQGIDDFAWTEGQTVEVVLKRTDSLGPDEPWATTITVGTHDNVRKTGFFAEATSSAISDESFVYEAFEYNITGIYQERDPEQWETVKIAVTTDRELPADTVVTTGNRVFVVSEASHRLSDGEHSYEWPDAGSIGWQNPGDRFEFTFHLGTGPWATPEVTLPADGVIWDADMTVNAPISHLGYADPVRGLYFTVGSVTPNSFSFLGEDYEIRYLNEQDRDPGVTGYLTFGQVDELPAGLTLSIGDRQYLIGDAAYDATAQTHVWDPTVLFGWAHNEQVAVQLKVTEDPTPLGTQVLTASMTTQSGQVDTYRSSGYHSSFNNSGLSQKSFSHDNTTYEITGIYERATEGESDLYVTVAQLPDRSTLRVNGRNYSVHDGEYDADAGHYVWHNSLRFGWANGQSVPVSMCTSEPVSEVAAPEGDPVWERNADQRGKDRRTTSSAGTFPSDGIGSAHQPNHFHPRRGRVHCLCPSRGIREPVRDAGTFSAFHDSARDRRRGTGHSARRWAKLRTCRRRTRRQRLRLAQCHASRMAYRRSCGRGAVHTRPAHGTRHSVDR